ncbi:hypothetical protein [Cupriavidus necator]|uniref:hypothetical protein n=1 Tax=Cupriavidus necator TaxID=106590 RepID=UPI0005B4E4FF|nr:hypothetical protein [Cupriavidus necator]
MARFRIETVTDPATGLIYTEMYYPENAATPSARTKPIYPSHEAAEADAVKMFQDWAEGLDKQ